MREDSSSFIMNLMDPSERQCDCTSGFFFHYFDLFIIDIFCCMKYIYEKLWQDDRAIDWQRLLRIMSKSVVINERSISKIIRSRKPASKDTLGGKGVHGLLKLESETGRIVN